MIQLENISKIYHKGKKNEFMALNHVNLEIRDGEMVAITGKSGAGKSTLLHILAFIDSFDSGTYSFNGTSFHKFTERNSSKIRNREIGIVMQDFALIEEFTAYENIVLPLEIQRKKKGQKEQAVQEALKAVNMEDCKNQKVHTMSGGQKQRIAIARAIINRPQIILADEPTGSLDSKNTDLIMKLFHQLHKQGKTVIIVTHDHEIADQCTRIL